MLDALSEEAKFVVSAAIWIAAVLGIVYVLRWKKKPEKDDDLDIW